MKILSALFFSIFGTLILSAASIAAYGAPQGINYALDAPIIDGKPDSTWSRATTINVANVLRPGFSGDHDLSASYQVMWDFGKLYVLGRVYDDTITGGSVNPWEDDSFELYIDGDASGGNTYDGLNDIQYLVRAATGELFEGVSSKPALEGVESAVHTDGGSFYFVELAIPWSTIGINVDEGSLVNLEVQVSERDSFGSSREAQISTHATTVFAWKDPSVFGQYILLPLPDGTVIEAANAFAIDGVIEQAWLFVNQNNAFRQVISSDTFQAQMRWRSSWDETYLYILAEVDDSAVFWDSATVWNDDSVEVFIDGDYSHGTVYDGLNDFQLTFRPGDPTIYTGPNSVANTTGILSASTANAQGYIYEVAIPWATIGVPASAAMSIGLELAVNDDVDGGDRDNYSTTHAFTNTAWSDPSSLGEYRLINTLPRDIERTTSPPVLDGVIDSFWNRAKRYTASNIIRGSISGSADLSLEWRALWDDENIYFAVTVTDDNIVIDSADPWHDDSIEIYLDLDNSKNATYDRLNDYHILIRPDGSEIEYGPNSMVGPSSFNFVSTTSATGYTLEIELPWNILGEPGIVGQRLGIDVQVNDDDDGQDREAKISTFADLDNTWQSPALMGTAELTSTPQPSNIAKLSGTVRDALTGLPIPGAEITVQSDPGSPGTAVIADANGQWVLDGCNNTSISLFPIGDGEVVQLFFSAPNTKMRVISKQIDYQVAPGEICQTATLDMELYPDQDADSDGLSDDHEMAIGTDPFNSDSDQDRLPDQWEVDGHFFVDLPSFGVSPLRKDILVECGYMTDRKPDQESIDIVIDSFNRAPVGNPNGMSGINLVIDLTAELPFDEDLNPVSTEYDALKFEYLSTIRSPSFHFCIFGNRYAGGSSSGLSFGINAQDFIVTLGASTSTWITGVAGTIMHELGHNLALGHGGPDHINYKPNYFSLMSYSYQFPGLTIAGVTHIYDFSSISLAALDETALSEVDGMDMADDGNEDFLSTFNFEYYTNGSFQVGIGPHENIDWNSDGAISTGSVAVDINNDNFQSVLVTWNDWDNIKYDANNKIGSSGDEPNDLLTIDNLISKVPVVANNLNAELIECAEIPLEHR